MPHAEHTPEAFDAIDQAIAAQLEKLPQLQRSALAKKARVARHLTQIQHANKTLGWSYARIADEVLKPAGLLLSGNTLRVYVQHLIKQREQPSKPSTQSRKHISKQSIRKAAPASPPATTPALSRTVGGADGVVAGEHQPTEHAASRRARART